MKAATLKKPTLATSAVLDFAEGGKRPRVARRTAADTASVGQRSGLVPAGDRRLTANIRADLHMKLKLRAVRETTTVGELLESWIQSWE